MSQHDYNIANQPGATFRADVNALAESIASLNSGAVAPSVTFANMFWYDTTTSQLKIRNPGNTAWIVFASISGSTLAISAGALGLPTSGDWFGATVRFPRLDLSGYMEVGPIIDFHPDAAGTEDYRTRLQRATGANGQFSIQNSGTGGVSINPGSGGLLINNVVVGTVPVGAIFAFGGTTVPTGCLFLNGQNVSRTTYALLFAIYSTTYGVGDGSTTFTLPDLRGRVIAGQDDMGGVSANRLTGLSGGVNGDTLGAAGGDEGHTLTTAQMPVHTHVATESASSTATTSTINVAAGGHAHTTPIVDDDGNFGSTGFPNSSRALILGNLATDAVANHNHTAVSGTTVTTTVTVTNANTGSGGEHNNVQPTFILNYVVFTGV